MLIKLPFVNKVFVLSFFKWPLYTGFTVFWFHDIYNINRYSINNHYFNIHGQSSQTQNKAQWLAACGHVSASSQSLRFILRLRLYSGFITSMPEAWAFIYCFSVFALAANALVRLCGCTGSSELAGSIRDVPKSSPYLGKIWQDPKNLWSVRQA